MLGLDEVDLLVGLQSDMIYCAILSRRALEARQTSGRTAHLQGDDKSWLRLEEALTVPTPRTLFSSYQS